MGSASSRPRDEYSRSSPRGREDYNPQGIMRDSYDSSPPMVRHEYDHSSQSRARNDYDQGRNDYGEYERSRGREEYERHSPQPRMRDYSPSRSLKDDYTTLEEYEDSQGPRRREEVGEGEEDEDEEIDFNLEETTAPTAASSGRVLDDYSDNRVRKDFDYDQSQSIHHIDDYPRRDEYPHQALHHQRPFKNNNSQDDDYRSSEGDYEGYGRHYREVLEAASHSSRNQHHLHPHHHQHHHHHHHHSTDTRQVS